MALIDDQGYEEDFIYVFGSCDDCAHKLQGKG
jgi:hypothetical protein